MSAPTRRDYTLDPVTFEVLKNAFVTTVDLMAEQILRTCHSFVIYARDFSSALCDAEGNTVMQGSQDIAVHVGTLHFKAKAVHRGVRGRHPPRRRVRHQRPLPGRDALQRRLDHPPDLRRRRDHRLRAVQRALGRRRRNACPGSFDVTAKEHFGEGQRIPPVRIWDKGRYLNDVARLILSNTRAPADTEGDLKAQAEATRVCEREILRLVDKYSRDTIVTAFAEVQDYVENLTRTRIAELPDGVWETEDYIDSDPTLEEGLIPIKVRMEIEGDQIRYDLSGSHAAVGTFLNAGFGSAMSGVVGGTKTFFPEVPLNSGFYRAVDIDLGPEGTVVNAPWPVAVTGFCSGPYEKIMACAFEIWSQIMPERAIACSFNLEYLLVGGRDARSEDRPFFMWYDWMVGGWGGRNGRDGSNCTSPVFGVGLAVQPLEGQERLSPVLTSGHEILADSGGPGRFRGGCGVEKGGTLTQAERTVVSYCCDRARSITWGIEGGLPSSPHGVWLNKGTDDERFLGAIFSNVEISEGDFFTRPSAGGGGYGDPLERDPDAVCEDVIDGYVTIDRALKDYGVVVEEIDAELSAVRGRRRGHRAGARAGSPPSAGDGSRPTPRRSRAATATASSTCSTSCASTRSSSTGAPASCCRTRRSQFRAMVQRRAASKWED